MGVICLHLHLAILQTLADRPKRFTNEEQFIVWLVIKAHLNQGNNIILDVSGKAAHLQRWADGVDPTNRQQS